MDYTKQIFEMLGVEPEEEFKLKFVDNDLSYQAKIKYKYKLDKNLQIFWFNDIIGEWRKDLDALFLTILNGTVQIVKIPRPTAEEQLAIDYARVSGYKWLAKNKSDNVYAFKRKPVKLYSDGYWYVKELFDNVGMLLHIPISFIHWEDKEPFYIEEDEIEKTEVKKVCEYYSEGKCMARICHPNVVYEGNKNRCYTG